MSMGSNCKNGRQTIRCNVASCMHHTESCGCELDSICVEPGANCSTGNACDESLCGSYRAK